ncbi:MAG: OmpH family outer membrane protein [Bacteroidales bacterium]|nr:OmpH family outer membrane protein [Bacteroidales bacterium]MCF8404913.1 OmpH family outer membrane protein [Bacteroidales bacterium]
MTENGNQNQLKLNISIALSILAIIGLVALYGLYFTQNRTNKDTARQLPTEKIENFATGSMGTIAFVNTDEILAKYELVKKLSKQLEKERDIKDNDLQQRQKEYETEASYFQESVQNQSISEQSAQKIYEQLMAKQQDIYQLQEQYAAELGQKEYEINIVLLDSIKNYLDRMNIDNRFDYILNYNLTGNILHAKDTFDITWPVISGLNKEYTAKYTPK